MIDNEYHYSNDINAKNVDVILTDADELDFSLLKIKR